MKNGFGSISGGTAKRISLFHPNVFILNSPTREQWIGKQNMIPFSKSEQQAFALGYRVSEDGLTIKRSDGQIIKTTSTKNGYKRFCIGPNFKRTPVRIHRLQAFQMFGDAIYQEGIVCRHLDGNPLNNAVSNIALGTQSQNMMDRSKECRQRCAFKASRSIVKHDHSAVVEFYKEHGFTATLNHFKISSRGTLSFILNKSATAPKPDRVKRKQKSSHE